MPSPSLRRPALAPLVLIVFAWLLVAGLIVQANLALVRQPLPGFAPMPNLHLPLRSSLVGPNGEALPPPSSLLLAMEGRPIQRIEEVWALTARHPAGTPFRSEFLTPEGKHVTITLRSVQESPWAVGQMLFNYIFAAGLHLLAGLLVLWWRPRHPAARAHWLFCVVMAFLLLGNISDAWPYGIYLFNLGLSLALPAFTALALHCPLPLGTPASRRRWMGLAWSVGSIHAGIMLYSIHHPAWYFACYDKLFIAASLMPLLLVCVWGYLACSRQIPPTARAQARIILAGGAVAMLPFPTFYFLPLAFGFPPFQPGLEFSDAAFGIFPLAIAFAIIRHQLFDLTWVIRRATVYAGVLAGLAGLYAGASALTSSFVRGNSAQPAIHFLAALLVALALRPWHEWLRARVDRLFLGERADALRMLAQVDTWTTREPETLAREALGLIERALAPRWASMTMGAHQLAALGEPPAEPPPDDGFELPLRSGETVLGRLRLGPKRNAMPYSPEERTLLGVLASHAAIGLLNARLVEEQVALRLKEGRARARAEERRQLVSQIVHDLRQDLFNITISAERAVRSETAPDALKTIRASVERMERFLNEKVRWAQEGREPTETLLTPALDAVCLAIAPTLEGRGQRLERAEPPVPVRVPLSELECEQIVLNLLTNASKFSPVGSTLRLEASLVDDSLGLFVADEGPGIAPDLLDQLASGRRADAEVPGYGLGLQNVQALLERVGGELSWRNEAQGAVVEVWLPAREAEAPVA